MQLHIRRQVGPMQLRSPRWTTASLVLLTAMVTALFAPPPPAPEVGVVETRGVVKCPGAGVVVNHAASQEAQLQRGLTPLCPRWLDWQSILRVGREASLSDEQFVLLRSMHDAYRNDWTRIAEISSPLLTDRAEQVFQCPRVRIDPDEAIRIIRARRRAERQLKLLDEALFERMQAVLSEKQRDLLMPWLRAERRAQYVLEHPLAGQYHVFWTFPMFMNNVERQRQSGVPSIEYLRFAERMVNHMEKTATLIDEAIEDWYKDGGIENTWNERKNRDFGQHQAYWPSAKSWRTLTASTIESCDEYMDAFVASLNGMRSTTDEIVGLEMYVSGMEAMYQRTHLPLIVAVYANLSETDLSSDQVESLNGIYLPFLREASAIFKQRFETEATRPAIDGAGGATGLAWPRFTPRLLSEDPVYHIADAARIKFFEQLGNDVVRAAHSNVGRIYREFGPTRQSNVVHMPTNWVWPIAAQAIDLVQPACDVRAIESCRTWLTQICGDDVEDVVAGWSNHAEAMFAESSGRLEGLRFDMRAFGNREVITPEKVEDAESTAIALHAKIVEADRQQLELAVSDHGRQVVEESVATAMVRLARAYELWKPVRVEHQPRSWPECISSFEHDVNLVALINQLEHADERLMCADVMSQHVDAVQLALERLRAAEQQWLFAVHLTTAISHQRPSRRPDDGLKSDAQIAEEYNREHEPYEQAMADALQARAHLADLHRRIVDACCLALDDPDELRQLWRERAYPQTEALRTAYRDKVDGLESLAAANRAGAAIGRRIELLKADVQDMIDARMTAERQPLPDSGDTMLMRAMVDHADLLAADIDAEHAALVERLTDED